MKEEEEEDLYVQPDLGKGLSGVLNLLRSQRVKILKKKHMVDEMTVLFEIMRVKVRNKKKT